MSKRLWWKSALLTLAAGVTTGLVNGACLEATIQRVLVAVAFD